MKLKIAVATALLLLGTSVIAQTKYNCTTTGCNFITDPFPASPSIQPTQCKFVVCNIAGCSNYGLKTATPVVGPVNAVYCSFPNQIFNPGTYSVAAIAVAADGAESGISNILSFQSSAGAPPAPVLKITSPVL